MTIDELEAAARIKDTLLLHMPPTTSKARTRRLAGTHGPRGEILCEGTDGTHVVRFKSAAVIRWCKQQRKTAEAAAKKAARKKRRKG